MNQEQLRTLALSFSETTEEPHFGKTFFRVKKKIFAAYDEKNDKAMHDFENRIVQKMGLLNFNITLLVRNFTFREETAIRMPGLSLRPVGDANRII
jgi:hypothetical protein